MRDRWYGDNRDVVKWASLVRMCRDYKINRILQVAFYQNEDRKEKLRTNRGELPIPPEVRGHFRDIRHIKAISGTAHLDIKVFKKPFCQPRAKYFTSLLPRIAQSESPLLVFLDPDTGIAPKTATLAHVKAEEIKNVFQVMKSGGLALYQHRRRKGDWLEETKHQFASAIGVLYNDVEIFRCEQVAQDVALFAVTKESH